MPCLCAVSPHIAGLLALGALLASPATGAAELYKWTDSKGVIHYSDTPPPKGEEAAQRVRLAGSETPVAEKKAAEPVAEAAKPADPAPTALPDTPENRKRVCEQAKASLDLLQSKFQVADSSGTPLDEKARAERTAAASQNVAKFCQNPG